MEIRFKNITITEKHIFNFISIAVILTLIFQLYLKFVAKIEVKFKPLIFTTSMLFLWFYLSKKEKSAEDK
ncbi:hypothetical protein CIL05_20230 [Virgibacillus profundi]|uniref:Uncharacterized protein n=1 Tax=Virgibacillus profundi TaxID=2024555 RepID=A0A2A2I8Y0_9BACI|nr:hypothetical protein CIL05_20230 [Virgibacillus profundi]PXY51899.1 hypothetical protein CIT14_20450 [Virgibacillus profundi]